MNKFRITPLPEVFEVFAQTEAPDDHDVPVEEEEEWGPNTKELLLSVDKLKSVVEAMGEEFDPDMGEVAAKLAQEILDSLNIEAPEDFPEEDLPEEAPSRAVPPIAPMVNKELLFADTKVAALYDKNSQQYELYAATKDLNEASLENEGTFYTFAKTLSENEMRKYA